VTFSQNIDIRYLTATIFMDIT